MEQLLQLFNEPSEWLATAGWILSAIYLYKVKGLKGVANMLCVKIGEHGDKTLVEAIAAEQNKVLETQILPKSGAKIIE